MRPYTLNPHKPHETFKDTRIHYATLNTQPHPNPTPQPPHPPTTHEQPCTARNALDQAGQERTRDTHPTTTHSGGQVSSQDPTACTSPPTTPTPQGRRASPGDQQQKRSTQPHPHPATHPDHRSNERRGQPGTDQVCDPVRNQMKGEPPTPPPHPHTREQVSSASWSTHHLW
jgi:hypothetical protein